jgi:hypothetical protein
MLLFEYNIKDQEVIIEGEPTFDLDKKWFSVIAKVLSTTPKWAGYPEFATLTGSYDLNLLQKLKSGEHFLVTGGYSTGSDPGMKGKLFATKALKHKPNVKEFLSSLQGLSQMAIEPGCGKPHMHDDELAEHKKREVTDVVFAWRNALTEQGKRTEPLIERFLLSHPEHFKTPEGLDLVVDDPWEHVCRLVAELNQDNPKRPGYPWVAPQGVLDAVVGQDARNALYDYVRSQGLDVVRERSRPSLSSASSLDR